MAVQTLEDCINNNTITNEDYLSVQGVMEFGLQFERSRMNINNQKKLLSIQTSVLAVVEADANSGDNMEVEIDDEENINEEVSAGVKIVKREFTTSLIEVEAEHQCQYCNDKRFKSFKSLQRHHRLYHKNEEKLTSKDFTERNRIVCLLPDRANPEVQCKKEVEQRRICRHLKLTHKEEKPAKKEFKGFTTDNSKDYKVHWGGLREQNPPAVEYVKIVPEEDLQEVVKEVVKESDGAPDEDMADMEENTGEDSQEVVKEGVNEGDGAPDEDMMADTEENTNTSNLGAAVPDIHDLDDDKPETILEEIIVGGLSHNIYPDIHDLNHEMTVPDAVMEEIVGGSFQSIGTPDMNDDLFAAITTTSTIDNVSVSPSLAVIKLEDLAQNSSFGSLHSEEVTLSFGSSQSSFVDGAMTETGPNINLKSEQGELENLSPSKNMSSPHNQQFLEEDFPVFIRPQIDIRVFDKAVENGFWSKSSNDCQVDEQQLAESLNVELGDNDEDDKDDDDEEDEDDNSNECVEIRSETFDYTRIRHERRNNIEAVPDLSSLEGNSEVIEQFTKWWKEAGSSCVTVNKDTSTLRGSLTNLFHNQDSFLNFQTSSDGSFSLSRLLLFTSENFLSLPSPISWISKIGGSSGQDMPSRRTEMLKSYLRFLAFINHVLNEYSFTSDQMQMKGHISKHLKDIQILIQDKKLFGQLKKLYDQQTAKKKQMLNIIKPYESEKLHNCLKTWYRSQECSELEQEVLSIYKKGMELKSKGRKMSPQDFNRFSKCVLFELALFDKSRVGVYSVLTNQDYIMKRAAWVPPEMMELEFSKLPTDCLLYKPPQAGARPSSYEMEISGDRPGLKNNQKQSVIINERVFELLEKMW